MPRLEMGDISEQQALSAIQEFNAARARAVLEQILANLSGRPADLLSYEEVREAIGGRETGRRELREIPVEAIVGSVGRYSDFTRSFLPRHDDDEQRWARVWAHMGTMVGLPPIEVYQMGDAFFVIDGNHRVSVARQQSFSHIEAYVTKVEAPVALSTDDRPEDLILKARYARFLEKTELDTSVPEIDLSMSVAGNYRVLENQIWRHQEWLAQQSGQDLPFPEAARFWYWDVYWPVIDFIRKRGMMRDFPERTETDLYVWIARHRQALEAHLGWSLDAETTVLSLADEQTLTPRQVVRRLGKKVHEAITPTALESGPTVGEWRESWLATYREDRLFSHILVAIDGKEGGWNALRQAMRVAWREEGSIFGLHVVETVEEAGGAAALAVKDAFERRCQKAGIPGQFTIATGPAAGTICYRARWADLVVVSLNHPPGPQPVDRLSSRFGQLVRRCPRPVLAIPRLHASLDHILLAYDGSPKADEALYVAAYLAGQWQVPLTVVVALGKGVTEKTVERARAYLQAKDIRAEFVHEKRPAASLILSTARNRDCGLIIMGGYGLQPVMEIVMGSVVDEVLRTRDRPVLICR